ncbi:MAG: PKD domain-containing protein [Planctomycetes bacterium]|nr:PKD domain-containing protein [Planctomycetota bacterium]
MHPRSTHRLLLPVLALAGAGTLALAAFPTLPDAESVPVAAATATPATNSAARAVLPPIAAPRAAAPELAVGGPQPLRTALPAPAPDDGLKPVIQANRLTGVAPLYVFVDGMATPGVPRLHDARFEWDFGDPQGPLARWNKHSGFVGAYVYENPGEYTISLKVADPSGKTGTSTAKVRVNPFSGVTLYCSSSQGDDVNNGRSEGAAVRTYDRVIQLLALQLSSAGPAAVRVLFRRGDSFASDRKYSFPFATQGRPILFGAFGSGPKPVIQWNGPAEMFYAGEAKGLRFVDLDIRGTYDFQNQSGTANSFFSAVDCSDWLYLRCNYSKLWVGIGASPFVKTVEDIALFECTVTECQDHLVYTGGHRFALVGNDLQRTRNSHAARLWQIVKGVVRGNTIWDAGYGNNPNRQILKIHSLTNEPTRDFQVCENSFRGQAWSVCIAPKDRYSTDVLVNGIVERNTFLEDVASQDQTQIMLMFCARQMTVRNNVFRMGTRSPWTTAVWVWEYGNGVPTPDDISIYNNTAAHMPNASFTDTQFLLIEAQNGTNIRCWNNVLYAPNSSSSTTAFVGVTPGFRLDQLTESNNLFYGPRARSYAAEKGNGGTRTWTFAQWTALGKGAGSITSDPLLAAPPHNLRPTTQSPFLGNGVQVPGLWDDFDGLLRPRGGASARGAYLKP